MKRYEFTELEQAIIREALIEYYQTVSKPVIASGKAGPYATEFHNTVVELKEKFKNG